MDTKPNLALVIGGPWKGRIVAHPKNRLDVPLLSQGPVSYDASGPLPEIAVECFSYVLYKISTGKTEYRYWIPSDIRSGREIDYILASLEINYAEIASKNT